MKTSFCFLVLLGICPLSSWAQASAVSTSAPSVRIAYPSEKASMPFVANTFIFGSVSPSSATLRINSQEVSVYKNGAFLAYVPVFPGTFTFRCEVSLGTTTAAADRTVFITEPFIPGPTGQIVLPAERISPREDLRLMPGDWLLVQARGTPDSLAEFKIPKVEGGLPMVQTKSGLYEGAYLVAEGDSAEQVPIEVRLKHPKLGKIREKSKGRVTLGGRPFTVQVSSELATVRTGAGRGYMLFVPQGIQLTADGAQGAQTRVRLSDSESGWVDSSSLQNLPEGTPPPQAVLSTIRTSRPDGNGSSFVHLSLSGKAPYKIEERDDSILLTFYYTQSHANWIVYDSSDALVREIVWRQVGSNVCEVEILLHSPFMGYRASYGDSGLSLELRPIPQPGAKGASPLKGRSIVLDPGHGGKENGAVGPLGTWEKDVNLALALTLKKKLEQKGALISLTRETDQDVPLMDRPKIAWQSKADVFLSLHHNALPDGENPFAQPRGFSVFYYHPHSRALAEAVHRAYVQSVPLADENLRYGNLLVARTTEMPAVLVESAYLMFPEQEEKLLSSEFQNLLAETLLKGLEDYFYEPQ